MNINQQIANYLMLKTIGLQNVSLYHGKMGVVLALYLYAYQAEKEYINKLLRMTDADIVVVWDAGIILPYSQLRQAIDLMIIKNERP